MRDKLYSKKSVLLLAFKLVVSLCFLGFVLHKIDLSILKGCLKRADSLELLFAFATLVAGGFCGAASWRFVLKSKGYQLPFLKVAAMHWCGMFFNSFLPSNIGGDFYKGFLLVKGNGGGGAKAAVSILLDRVINFSLLVLMGVVAFCVMRGLMGTAIVAVVGFVFFVMVVRTLAMRKRDSGGGRLLDFIMSAMVFFRDGRNCALAFTAAAFSQGLKVGCHIFLIRAMGLDLDVNCVWYIIPLFGVISALPISLGGIGIREYAAIGISGYLAVAQEELVVLSLASHLLFVGVNCLGFIPFLTTKHTKRRITQI